MNDSAPTCFCGSRTVYQDSKAYYHGKSYGMRWICERWPACNGSVGAHPNGTPLGTVPDALTKELRRQCHAIVDPLWQEGNVFGDGRRNRMRSSVYRYMQVLMDLPPHVCHIGMFDADQCSTLLRRMAATPYEPHHQLSGGPGH